MRVVKVSVGLFISVVKVSVVMSVVMVSRCSHECC